MTQPGESDTWETRQARIDRNLRRATHCLTVAAMCVALIIVLNVGHLAGWW